MKDGGHGMWTRICVVAAAITMILFIWIMWKDIYEFGEHMAGYARKALGISDASSRPLFGPNWPFCPEGARDTADHCLGRGVGCRYLLEARYSVTHSHLPEYRNSPLKTDFNTVLPMQPTSDQKSNETNWLGD
jgi:hypothetical protein